MHFRGLCKYIFIQIDILRKHFSKILLIWQASWRGYFGLHSNELVSMVRRSFLKWFSNRVVHYFGRTICICFKAYVKHSWLCYIRRKFKTAGRFWSCLQTWTFLLCNQNTLKYSLSKLEQLISELLPINSECPLLRTTNFVSTLEWNSQVLFQPQNKIFKKHYFCLRLQRLFEVLNL